MKELRAWSCIKTYDQKPAGSYGWLFRQLSALLSALTEIFAFQNANKLAAIH
jgi:hypothetical protein